MGTSAIRLSEGSVLWLRDHELEWWCLSIVSMRTDYREVQDSVADALDDSINFPTGCGSVNVESIDERVMVEIRSRAKSLLEHMIQCKTNEPCRPGYVAAHAFGRLMFSNLDDEDRVAAIMCLAVHQHPWVRLGAEQKSIGWWRDDVLSEAARWLGADA